MARLAEKVAVVTGASKGIGAVIAQKLAREGATVVVNYASDKAGAEATAHSIEQQSGRAVVVGGSVANAAEVGALFAEVGRQFGRLDILVNNAGVHVHSPLATLDEALIDRIFGTNVKGLLLATQAALPLFPAAGGSIINLGSLVSEMTPPGGVIYNSSKGAVDAITRTLAKELGPRHIRVNSVNPGLVATEGNKANRSTGMEQMLVSLTPLGRVGQPDDIADVVAFLASEEARWVTGALLAAGGGLR